MNLAGPSKIKQRFSGPDGAANAPSSRARWYQNKISRVLLWTSIGLACIYLLVATAIFGVMRFRRGIHELTWMRIVLPTGWESSRALVGSHHIAVAQFLARGGHGSEALHYARAGMTKVPAHREGRLLLSRLLTASRQPGAAQDVLIAGLVHHQRDSRYLEELFGSLIQRQDDERAVVIARRLLEEKSLPVEARRAALLAGATACYFRGNFDQAEEFLRSNPAVAASLPARQLSAKINWERGHRDLALWQLRSLATAFPNAWEVHAELVSRLRQSNLSGEARRASLAFQIARPELPGPRIELLHTYREDGDIGRLGKEIDSLIQEFPGDPAILVRVAEFAATTGDHALASRLLDHARAWGLPEEAHAFLLVEALVAARDYHGASAMIRTLLREQPDWTPRHGPLIQSLQAVASLGSGDYEAARLFLAQVLHQPALRAENLLALSNRFAELGAADQAHEILARAFSTDRRNQAVLTRLVEFDLNLNRIDQLPDHLSDLLTMRRPSPDILRVARHKLGSDLFLFSPGRSAVLDAVHAALETEGVGHPRL